MLNQEGYLPHSKNRAFDVLSLEYLLPWKCGENYGQYPKAVLKALVGNK